MREALRGFGLPSPFPRDNWKPSILFSGSVGLVIDPSWRGALTQDAAGTVPVTAPGQPVGRVLDQSGGARHATQSTSAARPRLVRLPASGARNRVRPTSEAMSQWDSGGSVTVADNVPGGATITAAAGNIQHTLISARDAAPSNADLTITVEAKAGTEDVLILQPQGDTPSNRRNYSANLTTGVVTTLGGAGEATTISASSESMGNGWWKITLKLRPQTTAGVGVALRVFMRAEPAWTAVGTETLQIRRVQIETGTVATGYQTVKSGSEILEAGAPDSWALSFDGVDDWLATNSFDWLTDEVTIVAAIRKRSDAAEGQVAGFGLFGDQSAFAVQAPGGSLANHFVSVSHGGIATVAATSDAQFIAPVSAVVSMQGKISSDINILRLNGLQVSATSADQGTAASFGSKPFVMGRRNTSFYASMDLYGLVAINRTLNAQELMLAERWAAAKCGVVL